MVFGSKDWKSAKRQLAFYTLVAIRYAQCHCGLNFLEMSEVSGESGPDSLNSYLHGLLEGRFYDEKTNLLRCAPTDFEALAMFVRNVAKPGHVLKLDTEIARLNGRKLAVFVARRVLESLGYKSEFKGDELYRRFVKIDPASVDAVELYTKFFSECWYDGEFVHKQLAAMTFEKTDQWARKYPWYKPLRKLCMLPDIDDKA